MTSDGGAVLAVLFHDIWGLFTSWYIPGTRVTPALLFIFLSVASFGLRWIISVASGARLGNSLSMPQNLESRVGRAFDHER